MLEILGYIIGGAIIGVVARLLKPGADPMSWVMTIVIGILGAVIGGMLLDGGWLGWVVAIIVAIALLFVYEMIRAKMARNKS